MDDLDEKEKSDPPAFWREIFSGRAILDGIIENQKDALRFARAGAIIGAIIGIGLGVYGFGTFGLIGVGVGLIAGAIIFGIAAWLMYQLA